MEPRPDAEFLERFPRDGVARILAVLDVAAGRQPQPGLPVTAEQHVPALLVERDEVRDEVFRRRVGRDRPEKPLP